MASFTKVDIFSWVWQDFPNENKNGGAVSLHHTKESDFLSLQLVDCHNWVKFPHEDISDDISIPYLTAFNQKKHLWNRQHFISILILCLCKRSYKAGKWYSQLSQWSTPQSYPGNASKWSPTVIVNQRSTRGDTNEHHQREKLSRYRHGRVKPRGESAPPFVWEVEANCLPDSIEGGSFSACRECRARFIIQPPHPNLELPLPHFPKPPPFVQPDLPDRLRRGPTPKVNSYDPSPCETKTIFSPWLQKNNDEIGSRDDHGKRWWKNDLVMIFMWKTYIY